MTIEEKIARAKTDYDEVYEAGYANGQAEGGDTTAAYDEGFEAGKKAERNAYWDEYQDYGNRGNWAQAFYNIGWTDFTYNPNYAIKAGKNQNCNGLFGYSRITDTKVPIDLSIANSATTSVFANSYLKTIRLLKVSENLTFSSWFYNCHELESITFEGVIGQNGLNLQYSPKLNKASIESVINCLSTTTSGLTVTLSKTAVDNAFTAEEKAALIATRPNWTISLV